MSELACVLQEDTRQRLVFSENKVRQLETQVCEEQLASGIGKKVMHLMPTDILLYCYLTCKANWIVVVIGAES